MNESPTTLPDDGWTPYDSMGLDPSDAVAPDMWTGEPSDFGFPDDIPNGFDEPELESEFAGGISQPLHPSIEVANLPQALELDEFLANVVDLTNFRRERIVEALLSFDRRKRLNWLRWLKGKKRWTGKSLLLFLRFYDLVVRTPEWQPYDEPNALSRDVCYELVNLRVDYLPRRIVHKSWQKDWEDFSLYRYEFGSFASFAIFRAGLSPDDDWEREFRSRNGFSEHEMRERRGLVDWWDSDTPSWRIPQNATRGIAVNIKSYWADSG